MLFPTLAFAAFFVVVLPVSWLLMPHRIAWGLFMVAASWFFYGSADWRFVPLLVASTVVNHFFAWRIHRSDGTSRSAWTAIAVATNLAGLGWFKYIGFLGLSGQSILHFVGIGGRIPIPEIVLPIGISFFTFQALSYVIDTSRRKIKPVPLLDFAVYLSFFPHLIAGPIVRASEFLPQIKSRISPRVDIGKAFWLISSGLFKKVVIASYLGTYAVDPLFGFPHQHAGADALLGVYAYAIQIYADFSGYTDIAIGLALLLGIEFPQNFNAPYAATSLQDFWRRWHITLSRWLRDYLYIPLGGNRRNRRRTYLNVLATMLLGGLWHGAAWTFVAWGALHGIGLAFERWSGERNAPPVAAPAAGPAHDGAGHPPVSVPPPPPPPSSISMATVLAVAGSGLRSQSPPSRPAGPARPAAAGRLISTAWLGARRSAGKNVAVPVSAHPGPDRQVAPPAAAAAIPGTPAPAPGPPAAAPAPGRAPPPPSTPSSTPAPVAEVSIIATGPEDTPGATIGTRPGSGAVTPLLGEEDPFAGLVDAEPALVAPAARPPAGPASPAAATASPAAALATPPRAASAEQVATPLRHPTAPAAAGPAATVIPPPPPSPAPPPAPAPPGPRPARTGPNPAGATTRTRPAAVRHRWLCRLITFHVVCLAWIFFRATSFHNAVEVMGRILAFGGHHRPFNWKVAAVVVASLAVQWVPRALGPGVQAAYSRAPLWLQGLSFALVLSVIDLLGPAGVAPFIYFRF